MTPNNYNKLDEWVLTDTLFDMLRRAEKGDIDAARDALWGIARCLSTQNINPATGESLPVQDFVRDYVSRALYRMANGEDAPKAFNLQVRTGKPKTSYLVKKLVASLVHQAINEGGMKKMEAYLDVANHINKMNRDGTLMGVWRKLSGSGLYTKKRVREYYVEVAPDIGQLNLDKDDEEIS